MPLEKNRHVFFVAISRFTHYSLLTACHNVEPLKNYPEKRLIAKVIENLQYGSSMCVRHLKKTNTKINLAAAYYTFQSLASLSSAIIKYK